MTLVASTTLENHPLLKRRTEGEAMRTTTTTQSLNERNVKIQINRVTRRTRLLDRSRAGECN